MQPPSPTAPDRGPSPGLDPAQEASRLVFVQALVRGVAQVILAALLCGVLMLAG